MYQAIQGKAKILDWFMTNRDYPYFFIYNPINRETVMHSSPDVPLEEYPFERAMADLEHALSFLQENYVYTIRLQKKFKINHATERREINYKHIEETKIPIKGETEVAGIFGFDNEKIISGIEKRSEELYNRRWMTEQNQKLTIENTELKLRLEAAEKKVKEHEESVDGRKFATQIYGDLKPLIPEIIGYLKPLLTQNANNISGIPKKVVTVNKMENTQANTSEQIRLEKAMEKWFTADNEALELIEKVAQLATNPSSDYKKYKMAILLM